MNQHSNSFRWPAGQAGAVSLSFDDGMPSHVGVALPELDRLDLKGTFYVIPRGGWWEHGKDYWPAAHAHGHEIGNHTLSHPCCLNIIGPEGLAGWTLERIEADILEAQRLLDAHLPEPRPRSFAYPCYETDVGHGLARQSYVPVVARHLPVARARRMSRHQPIHPLHCDLHCLTCWPAEDLHYHSLIGLAEDAVTRGGWVIFVFHGIDEGHLPTGLVHFRRLLEHLAAARERIWTATVAEVGQYLAQFRGIGQP